MTELETLKIRFNELCEELDSFSRHHFSNLPSEIAKRNSLENELEKTGNRIAELVMDQYNKEREGN